MKIRVISKGSTKSHPVCPWLVDYPPEAAKD